MLITVIIHSHSSFGSLDNHPSVSPFSEYKMNHQRLAPKLSSAVKIFSLLQKLIKITYSLSCGML